VSSANQVIREAYNQFEEAFFRGDAAMLAEIYTEDAEWLVPGVPPIRGRESIAAAWKNILGSGGNRVRVDVHEVAENGDWAFEIGEFTATGPNGQTINSGKYMVIWRRDGLGNWRAYRDIFHWDIPPEGIAA